MTYLLLIGPNYTKFKRFQKCIRVEEKICCDRFLLTSEKCSTEDFRKEPKNRGETPDLQSKNVKAGLVTVVNMEEFLL